MAPVTRRSQAGGGIAKKAPSRKQRVQPARKVSSSWDFVDPQHAEEEEIDMQSDEENDVRDSVENHAIEPYDEIATQDQASDLDEVINPLREMADKVGREAERFAISLDVFLKDLPSADDPQGRYEKAQETVDKFRHIAQEAADNLRKGHEKEMRQQLRKEWRAQLQDSVTTSGSLLSQSGLGKSTALSGMKEEKIQELRQWQQEADLWELFRNILELHYQPEESDQQDRAQKIARIPSQHRYTPESEVLDRFLLEDPVARKRSLIKKWLEQTAENQGSDVPAIVEELESSSGRGKGLWSRGWLSTREKIKGEKRLRTWPSPSDSVQPQIRSSSGSDMLVTTLDPDAPLRQQRSLEKPDAYFERVMWMACWEMLRRGKSWEEVRTWCEQRQEGWRAVAIGATLDGSNALSNAAWRRMCCLAAQSGCCNEYEAAVYGLLGGDVEAVRKVCRSVDDHLYAFYSCMLVQQFDEHLQQQFPERAAVTSSSKAGSAKNAAHDTGTAEEAVMNLILKLRNDTSSSTSSESVQPMKIIQSYLLADEAGSLITTLGTAVSDLSSLRGEEERIMVRTRPFDDKQKVLPETEVVLDPHTLRIAAHISVILRAFRKDELEGEELATDENVLVSYIQALRAARKRDLILVYASKLSPDRCIATMGRVLEDITQSREQRDVLRLMTNNYHMDVVSIMTEQLNFQLERTLNGEQASKPLRILEKSANEKLYPGQRIVEDFLPDMLDDSDMAIVRSLQWFEMLPGHWQATFNALSIALRKCLVAGRCACALEIVRNFPYDAIATQKSVHAVGRSVNIMDRDMPQPRPHSEEAFTWEILRQQSRTYYELELLVHAIEALSVWAVQERPYTSKSRPATGAPPPGLKKAKNDLTEAMAPVLAGLLQTSADDSEDQDLQQIRIAYIPEIVIAYNTALYTAGSTISRDNLLDAMDLSTTIAKDSNGISACFVQAGRMRELVDTFALMSKHMLVMKAEGKPRKPKKDRIARDLGMWEIGSQGGYDYEDSMS